MIETKTLPNGLRIVWEEMPQTRTAAIGIWVKAGVLYEPEEKMGISHFVEHMLFKGTKTQSAREIAVRMDRIGGQMNAFTAKECTCFYVKTLSDDLMEGLDLLSEMVHNPRLDDRDVETERGVILEEIAMSEDTPDELAVDQLFEACWAGHPLSFNILGTKQTVAQITAADMRAYMGRRYRPQNMVIAVAGNFPREELLERIERDFGGDKAGIIEPAEPPLTYRPVTVSRAKEIEQTHLALGFPAPALDSPDSYTCAIMSNILGGSMSSRLFQTVREERGLCYSIYSFTTPHKAGGLLGIYTGLNPSAQEEAMEVILREVKRFCDDGPTQEELSLGIRQIKTNLIMGAEGASSRMNSLGRGELLRDKTLSIDEILKKVDAVTQDGVVNLARETFHIENMSQSSIGNITKNNNFEQK